MLDVPHVRLRLRDNTAPWISNFLLSHPSDFLRDCHTMGRCRRQSTLMASPKLRSPAPWRDLSRTTRDFLQEHLPVKRRLGPCRMASNPTTCP